MFNFPFFRFPYSNPYYNYYNKIPLNQNLNKKFENDNPIDEKKSITDSNEFSNTNYPLFEILGIKLYLDDLIILVILFFLYQEKVNDEMLYIILLLLLFS